ncbi:MAG: hypothetical protein R3297_02890 [Desulfobulbales bacterium]|nr:hypothetical protein [Desulfobulbales bacterium]
MKSAIYLTTTFLVFVIIAACSSTAEIGEAPPKSVCSTIIDAKCIQCHYLTRVCEALGTKSVGAWKRSIKFMIKQGAQLTQDEQNKVIACLSSMPRGSDVVCK